jgi:hypothetical protein
VAGGRPRETLTARSSRLVRDVPRVTPRTPLDDVTPLLPASSWRSSRRGPADPDHLVGSVSRKDVVGARSRVLRRRMVLAEHLGADVPRVRRAPRRRLDHPGTSVPEAWLGRTPRKPTRSATAGCSVLAVRREVSVRSCAITPAPPTSGSRTGPDRAARIEGRTLDGLGAANVS